MIEFLGYDPGVWNEWRLISLAGWPVWFWYFAFFAAILILLLGYWVIRKLSVRQRILLLFLRGTGLLFTLFLLFMPGFELSHVTRSRSDVVFLFDTSASMALPAAIDESSRIEWLREFVVDAEEFLQKLSETRPLVSFGYDYSISPVNLQEIPNPTGEATDTREALSALLEQYKEKEFGGVLLFSDGADNGGFDALGKDGIPRDEVIRTFQRFEVPIHVFFSGKENSLRDLAISEVNVDEFAFVHNALEVEVVLSSFGLEEIKETSVTLRKGQKPISSKTVALPKEGGEAKVTFRLVPDEIGKAVYTLDVPVYDKEAVEENNRQEFVLKVIRDKIRVLQLVGRPSWDERFLRDLLKRDPNVDLISFFILRGPEDPQPVSPDELSLIPFPTEELFTEELRSFDVIVFQNFNFAPYGIGPYLPKVKEYVEEGGGLIMVGGDLSFSQGGYDGTSVEDVLPVDLLPGGYFNFDESFSSDDGTFDTSSFSPRLTEEGKRHPVSAWGEDAIAAEARWKKFPPLEGLNLVQSVKAGATILATHPNLRVEGEAAPVLVVDEIKKGRSIALLTESLWFWAFLSREQGIPGDAFRDFWRHAVRWLIKDPELKPLRLTADKERYALGETVRLQVRAYLPDYSPAANVAVSLSFGVVKEKERESIELRTDENGLASYEYAPQTPGAQEVLAKARLENNLVEEREVFVVLAKGDELRKVSPRKELLQSIANATGGNFYQLPHTLSEQDAQTLPLRPPRISRVNRRYEEPIWKHPIFLLLPICFFCLEWWLRRRWSCE